MVNILLISLFQTAAQGATYRQGSTGAPVRAIQSKLERWGYYDGAVDLSLIHISFEDLTAADHETAHGGYDPVYANEDSDRVLPVDVLRKMEKEGKIGGIYPYFFTTVGNGTAVASAKKYGEAIGKELRDAGIKAAILTST